MDNNDLQTMLDISSSRDFEDLKSRVADRLSILQRELYSNQKELTYKEKIGLSDLIKKYKIF